MKYLYELISRGLFTWSCITVPLLLIALLIYRGCST